VTFNLVVSVITTATIKETLVLHRARKIFELHLAGWASNSQLLLVQGTSPLAQVFKLINNL